MSSTIESSLHKYCEKRNLKVIRFYTTRGGDDVWGKPRGPHRRALVETTDGYQFRLYYNPNPRKFDGPARGWQKGG